MNLAAALANCAWLAGSLPAWRRFGAALEKPAETQQNLLRNLLADHAVAFYGRKFCFAEIRSYEQFRERVPVVDYEQLEPWISRICKGETQVLTNRPVTRLVPTSGSSGARKLIPFTAQLQGEFNAAIGPWLVDLWRQH